MRFEYAVTFARSGAHIAREGWNGKGMYVLLADGGMFTVDGRVEGDLLPFMVMKTVSGQFVPWLISQTDLVADDWLVVRGGVFAEDAQGALALGDVEAMMGKPVPVAQAGKAELLDGESALGYCPTCGAQGLTRERRPDGDTKCTNGHKHKSVDFDSMKK